METIIKYLAVDGKEFESELDCIEHEALINRPDNSSLDLLNIDFKVLPITPHGLEEAMYISVKDEKALKWINFVSREWGFYSPTGIGQFYYDIGEDRWVDINDVLDKMELIKKAFNI